MKLWGVTIDEIRHKDALLALEKPQVIFTPNPEILLEARRNRIFQRALSTGTLMLPDGHGLQFVSTLLKFPRWLRFFLYLPALLLFLFWKAPFRRVFPELIHGSDFMDDVVHFAAVRGLPVFFLGGKNGSAEGVATFFKKKYPRLTVAGVSSLDPSPSAFDSVKTARPQVLFVAYGAPKQELWIAEYAKRISGLKLVMAVGGSFDFYSGKVRRAPRFLRTLGLEWLWRLAMNPFQRIRRIWHAVVVFPLLTILE